MSKQLKLFDFGVSRGSQKGEQSQKRKISKEKYEAKRTRKFVDTWKESIQEYRK